MKRSELYVGQVVKERGDWQNKLVVMATEPWRYGLGNHMFPAYLGNGVAVAVYDRWGAARDRWYPAVYQLQNLWTVEQYEQDLERAKQRAEKQAQEREQAEREMVAREERWRELVKNCEARATQYAQMLHVDADEIHVSPPHKVELSEYLFLELLAAWDHNESRTEGR
ncbi:MAG: hypothetical protein ACYC3G_00645 [Minisyncoccota bacterium]